MNYSDDGNACARTQAILEAYLDGELPSEQARALEDHLESCRSCAAEHALALEVRSLLRELPQESCPDSVTRAVLSRVRAESWETRRRLILDRLTGIFQPVWRPALVTAVLLILLVTAALVGRLQRPSVDVSPEELARAEAQAKWALAYVGEVGRRTGILVREEVIESQVILPAKQAVETAFAPKSNE